MRQSGIERLPLSASKPSSLARLTIWVHRPLSVRQAQRIAFASAYAENYVKEAPFFIRGRIRENAENRARELNVNLSTRELLDSLRS